MTTPEEMKDVLRERLNDLLMEELQVLQDLFIELGSEPVPAAYHVLLFVKGAVDDVVSGVWDEFRPALTVDDAVETFLDTTQTIGKTAKLRMAVLAHLSQGPEARAVVIALSQGPATVICSEIRHTAERVGLSVTNHRLTGWSSLSSYPPYDHGKIFIDNSVEDSLDDRDPYWIRALVEERKKGQ
jgi:hypothetical protein